MYTCKQSICEEKWQSLVGEEILKLYGRFQPELDLDQYLPVFMSEVMHRDVIIITLYGNQGSSKKN